MALPIFATFLQKVYANPSLGVSPNDDWDKPILKQNVNLDCNKQFDNEINEIELY